MKDVDEMAASLIIESESGTWSGKHNSHNGYYAGDFSDVPRLPHNQLVARVTLYRVPEHPQPQE